MNRLSRETSPYLLQHQHNPVDWFAWGEEAFAEARRRDVPIFLSVGYSTCYWCHVMERESFEDQATAHLMNQRFVCVKVDREERPDVDDLYMASVQAFTHRGGWPMSVFLEPEKLRPFWAGTYFPREHKFQGVPTFTHVLDSIHRAWTTDRAGIMQQAEQLAEAVRERVVAESAPVRVGEGHISAAASALFKSHDRTHGGFGSAPKFPQPIFLEFLLDLRAVVDDQTRTAIDGVLKHTLDAMSLGGIFDQVGGGFHRYSVDEHWLVPHFEKMLYDNGQLLSIYARAAAVLKDRWHARVAARIVEYVLREMVAPEGAFWSAQDAEVNHREGQNYLWTTEQVRAALPPEDAAFAEALYGLTSGTNFRDPHHPGDAPANVLFLGARISESDWPRVDRINRAMLGVRGRRDQPGTDTKILAAWNGLMIGGLSVAARVLGDVRALDAARRAADFVVSRMIIGGELARSFAGGRVGGRGVLEDYACMMHGLLALAEAMESGGEVYVARAAELAEAAQRLFGDAVHGGYFDTAADQSDLFARARSMFDGSMPSAQSVMINALIDLARATGDATYLDRARAAMGAASSAVGQSPVGACGSVRALLRLIAIDRAAMERVFDGLPDATMASAHEPPDVVEILSPVESVELGPGEAATVALQVRIAPGYHINAADPGDSTAAAGLVGLRVHVVGGIGVAAYAEYPAGAAMGEGEGRVLVHEGTFDLPVVVERDGEWRGRPLLAVTYQACTLTECHAARTVELDVAIDRK